MIECSKIKEFTLYHTRITRTKWPGPILEGVRHYYTGVVHHIIEDDGKVYIGKSVCSQKDQYNKRIARNIARGRATMCMMLVGNSAPMPTTRIHTPNDAIEGYIYTRGYRKEYSHKR